MADSASIPSNSKRPVAPIPTEQDLIAFNHVAAGHEGMSSNASGSLVIKPCTQAEIDFYESAETHQLFQAHMPTFMGVLSLNQEQNANTIAPLLALAGQPVSVHHTPRASITSLPTISELLGPSALTSSSPNSNTIISSISAKRASWKPSGGKKLNTGLAIVLENVAAGFEHPNILDVKLGARLWADDAPASKRRKLDDVAKETTSGSLGFRIAGMKLYMSPGDSDHPTKPNVEVKDGYRVYNKQYGRNFSADNVHQGFAEYLGGLDPATVSRPRLKHVYGRRICKQLIRELESIQFTLENEESRMYSASILMVYEGDDAQREKVFEAEKNIDGRDADSVAKAPTSTSEEPREDYLDVLDEQEDQDDVDDDEEEEPSKSHDVRLIDFAHAQWTPGQGPDENVLLGVREVIRILKELSDDVT